MQKAIRDPQERKHQRGVDKLADRLLKSGRYTAVLKNVEYRVSDEVLHDLIGELDVLAIRGTVAHYYEVKCRENKSSYHHACDQAERVRAAFPQWDLKCVYVPLDGGIRRID